MAGWMAGWMAGSFNLQGSVIIQFDAFLLCPVPVSFFLSFLLRRGRKGGRGRGGGGGAGRRILHWRDGWHGRMDPGHGSFDGQLGGIFGWFRLLPSFFPFHFSTAILSRICCCCCCCRSCCCCCCCRCSGLNASRILFWDSSQDPLFSGLFCSMEGDLIPELIAGSFQDLFRISSGSLQDLFGIFSGLFSRISSRIDCIQKDCLSGPISGSFQDFFPGFFFSGFLLGSVVFRIGFRMSCRIFCLAAECSRILPGILSWILSWNWLSPGFLAVKRFSEDFPAGGYLLFRFVW